MPVFTGVTNDMRIAREEIFGPVLSILPSATWTRQSPSLTYGLSAYVFGEQAHAEQIAVRLDRTGRSI